VRGGEGRALSGFTVDLEVYSGPYEWLLALVLQDEVEIFEIPLKELVDLYRSAHPAEGSPEALERDTDFVDSAASLVLLKSRTLAPAPEEDPEDGEEAPLSPEELAGRLAEYLKIQRAAGHLAERFEANRGYYPTAHEPVPRPGRLGIRPERLQAALKRLLSRYAEPETRHLGTITVTLQELAALIRSRLSVSGQPLSFEELTGEMDRLRAAVTFAAALSLASEGHVRLCQEEPLGPLTLEPVR
jgi:segregation and condensation protein A